MNVKTAYVMKWRGLDFSRARALSLANQILYLITAQGKYCCLWRKHLALIVYKTMDYVRR